MARRWQHWLGRALNPWGQRLVTADARWLRYGWLRNGLLRLQRWAARPSRPALEADATALLEAAYCLRSVLGRYASLEEVSVGLESDRVVLLVRQPLPPALQGQVRALVDGRVEIRTAALDWPSCHAADGDHCNGDYDRS